MTDGRKRLLGGFLSSSAGLLTAAMIYLHPENLHAARGLRMRRVQLLCSLA